MTSFQVGSTASFSPSPGASARESADAWQATRAQTALATQFVNDKDDYLADEKREIGRQTSANEHELFVSCDAAEAMQQQFEHLRPEFIAVHDIATASSRKLLAGVAAAIGRTLQKLTIRRQGYGTPLATLEFIELATAGGGVLRMYTTESADTDAAARRALARMLLAYSRLGVVMVGDLPAHAVGPALKPLHDDMIAGPWPNRNLLLLPLATASNVVGEGVELTRGTGVQVRTTPQVTRPADAWNFISSSWSRLREQMHPDGTTIPAIANFADVPSRPLAQIEPRPGARPAAPAEARPGSLSMRPMPAVPNAATRAAAAQAEPADGDVLALYVQRLSELAGMVSCCVFDVATRRELAHAGAKPGAADLAVHGGSLLAAMQLTSRTLGLGHALPEAAITLGAHHLLLRAVPRPPGLALHAVLDKTHANLTLVRLQVLRLDTLFDDAAPR